MLEYLSVDQLVKITGGKLINSSKNLWIDQISIDSRQIYNPSKTLFVALQGAKAKGESFIPALVELGIEVYLVPIEAVEKLAETFEKKSFIGVPDTRKALQQIAKFTREQFKAPVVGITGTRRCDC